MAIPILHATQSVTMGAKVIFNRRPILFLHEIQKVAKIFYRRFYRSFPIWNTVFNWIETCLCQGVSEIAEELWCVPFPHENISTINDTNKVENSFHRHPSWWGFWAEIENSRHSTLIRYVYECREIFLRQ